MGRDSVRRRRAADATGCLPTWFATSTLVKSNDAVVGRGPSDAPATTGSPSRVTTSRASTKGRLVGAGSRPGLAFCYRLLVSNSFVETKDIEGEKPVATFWRVALGRAGAGCPSRYKR